MRSGAGGAPRPSGCASPMRPGSGRRPGAGPAELPIRASIWMWKVSHCESSWSAGRRSPHTYSLTQPPRRAGGLQDLVGVSVLGLELFAARGAAASDEPPAFAAADHAARPARRGRRGGRGVRAAAGRVILLCGIRSEPPLAMVAAELERMGAPFAWFDQRQALRTRLDVALVDGRPTGRLRTPEADVELASVRAAYIRAMDDRFLPEVESLAADAPARRRVRALHDRCTHGSRVTPAMVVNRWRPRRATPPSPTSCRSSRGRASRFPRRWSRTIRPKSGHSGTGTDSSSTSR